MTSERSDSSTPPLSDENGPIYKALERGVDDYTRHRDDFIAYRLALTDLPDDLSQIMRMRSTHAGLMLPSPRQTFKISLAIRRLRHREESLQNALEDRARELIALEEMPDSPSAIDSFVNRGYLMDYRHKDHNSTEQELGFQESSGEVLLEKMLDRLCETFAFAQRRDILEHHIQSILANPKDERRLVSAISEGGNENCGLGKPMKSRIAECRFITDDNGTINGSVLSIFREPHSERDDLSMKIFLTNYHNLEHSDDDPETQVIKTRLLPFFNEIVNDDNLRASTRELFGHIFILRSLHLSLRDPYSSVEYFQLSSEASITIKFNVISKPESRIEESPEVYLGPIYTELRTKLKSKNRYLASLQEDEESFTDEMTRLNLGSDVDKGEGGGSGARRKSKWDSGRRSMVWNRMKDENVKEALKFSLVHLVKEKGRTNGRSDKFQWERPDWKIKAHKGSINISFALETMNEWEERRRDIQEIRENEKKSSGHDLVRRVSFSDAPSEEFEFTDYGDETE